MGKRFPIRQPATLADVAKLAGVSTATVSKFLGDRQYYVAETTKERIAAAVEELDFRPNAIAQGLVRRRTNTVGVVVASLVNPLYPDLIGGIDEVLGGADFTLIFGSTEGSAAREAAVVRSMQQRQVDGIIMASVTMQDGEVGKLVASGLDVVLASRHMARDDLVDAIIIDNVDGAKQAVQHLIDHGHRRIAHLAGPPDIVPFSMRFATYRRVCAESGLDSNDLAVVAESTRQESGAAAVAELLDLEDPPTAVFVASDSLAFGVLEECARRGVRVPEDLAIVAFDNVWVGAMQGVQLSSVDSRAHEVGRLAAQRLLSRIEGRWQAEGAEPAAPELRVIPTELVRRRTCGCEPEPATIAGSA